MAPGTNSNDNLITSARGGIVLATLGLLSGSLSAAGVYIAQGAQVELVQKNEPLEFAYIETGRLLLPLVNPDGDLISYISIDAKLEVLAADAGETKQSVPVILNEINLVAWQTGLSAGPDGMLLNTRTAEKLYFEAAQRALGRKAIRRVLLISIAPA